MCHHNFLIVLGSCQSQAVSACAYLLHRPFLDQIRMRLVAQGTEDQVVPPNQATEMYEALKKQGLKTALVMFEGEQHGFRQATNIRRALDGEFFFYGKALGFNAKMPDGLEPVQVEN